MGDLAVQKMIAEVCFGARSEEDLVRDLKAYLERHELTADDVAAICAGPKRLPLYRRLIRNNLEHVVGQMMPRVRVRVNDAASGAFDASFAAFLAEQGPRT